MPWAMRCSAVRLNMSPSGSRAGAWNQRSTGTSRRCVPCRSWCATACAIPRRKASCAMIEPDPDRGWSALDGLWQRTQPGYVAADGDADSWHEETRQLQALGIATEAALKFLYFERPSQAAFEQWLQDKRTDHSTDGPEEDVLSEHDLAFWEAHGYLVLKQAVPEAQCAAARQAIWEFLDASPVDPASWYRRHDAQYGLMLTLFEHPALERN